MLLTALANEYHSDKGTIFENAHGYTLLYELLFSAIREQPIALLELGLAVGGPELGGDIDRKVIAAPSIAMWKDYFPRAAIYGFDISDFSAMAGDRFTFIRGDMGSVDDLMKIAALRVQFDVIIDDASHASYHQLLALSQLFGLLKPGGLYIIEDMDCRLPYQQSLPSVPRAADVLKQLQENKVPSISVPGIDLPSVRDQAGSVAIYTRGDLDRLAAIDRRRRHVPETPFLKNLERKLKGKHRVAKLAIIQRLNDVTLSGQIS